MAPHLELPTKMWKLHAVNMQGASAAENNALELSHPPLGWEGSAAPRDPLLLIVVFAFRCL